MKYLGFIFQKNGSLDEQIKDRVKKGAAVMGQVWGIGKRRFGRDWGRRVWLFDALVWSVVGYGVEVSGWMEWKKIESLHERYLRWIMNVEWRTPGYMVREELQRELLRGRAGLRAVGYEERVKRGEGGKIVRRCWEEVRERAERREELSE